MPDYKPGDIVVFKKRNDPGTWVGKIKPKRFHPVVRHATPAEIAAYEREEADKQAQIAAQREREAQTDYKAASYILSFDTGTLLDKLGSEAVIEIARKLGY